MSKLLESPMGNIASKPSSLLKPESCISASTMPIVWSVAGSDSGGGAGIQADLKTMNALGVHACTVITALTAQNTTEVSNIEATSSAMLAAQWRALQADLPPVAIKLGMLASQAHVQAVADHLMHLSSFVVCDPVMVSSNGNCLLEDEAMETMKRALLPRVDLLTPNLDEAARLLGRIINTNEGMEQAAKALLAFGVRAVFLKGGHRTGDYSQDVYTDGKTTAWLTSPRQNTRHHHGTGCTLSAAITAAVALGHTPLDACVIAKGVVNRGLRLAPGLGQGHGPLRHGGWPQHEVDLPWLTPTAREGVQRFHFPNCGEKPLGFYPIVNRASWLETLLTLGVSTVQLRIKDLQGDALEQEIAEACTIAKRYQARLFVNDYAELAVRYGAYGVHLGQSDLETANLKMLAEGGIRLGISTHCYWEVARALAIQPSYIAIGPIYPTTTKVMAFAPQGIKAMRRWRKLLSSYPLVGIGGVFIDKASELFDCGLDGLAVVRDLTQADDLPTRIAQWLALAENAAQRKPPRY